MLPTRRAFSLSVSGRILLMTIVVWVGLLAGLHSVLDRVFRPTFAKVESRLLIKDLERVEAAINRESDQLAQLAGDYAKFDEIRAYAADPSRPIPGMLDKEVLGTLALNAVFLFNEMGRPLHAVSDGALGDTREGTPLGFAREFPVIAAARAGGTAKHGLIRFNSGQLVFASAGPVQLPQSERVVATLVMLRWIDDRAILRLGEQVRLPLDLRSENPKGPALRAKDAEPVLDRGWITAGAWVRDPFGKPIARYEVRRETSILNQGEDTLSLAGIGSLAMLSLVLATLLTMLQLSVVRPLRHLTKTIELVRKTGDLDMRVGIHRHDEIGLLAYNFDRMLALLNERTHVLEELATTDGLTKLLNRRTVMDRLGELAELNASDEADALSILLLDVDHFKRINDSAGHAVGDRVLRQVASAIQAALKPGQLAGRYGGEEFLVVLPHYNKERAQRMAEIVRALVEDTNIQGLSWRVTVSIGVATLGQQSLHGLLATADTNLYRAKEAGRNRVVADDISPSLLPAASIPPPGMRAGNHR
jgi:diguanylate cyclase (GGDEF)-like protein